MWTGTLATWKCSKRSSKATCSRKRLRRRLRLRLRLHRAWRSAITFLIAFRKPSEGCPGYPWLRLKPEMRKARERKRGWEWNGEREKGRTKREWERLPQKGRTQSWNYEQAADHIGVFHNRCKANTWWKATAKAKGNYARLSREVWTGGGGLVPGTWMTSTRAC